MYENAFSDIERTLRTEEGVTKSRAFGDLRQSLLQKAFEAELT